MAWAGPAPPEQVSRRIERCRLVADDLHSDEAGAFAFNVLCGNVDAHSKNYSLLPQPGGAEWRRSTTPQTVTSKGSAQIHIQAKARLL